MLDAKSSDSMAGITVGFVVGLFVIYGSEYLVEYVEALDEKSRRDSDIGSQKKEIKYTYPDGMDPSENTNVLLTMTTVGKDRTRSLDMDELLDWEKGPVERASLAIASPQHRRHITEHLSKCIEFSLVTLSFSFQSSAYCYHNLFPLIVN